MDEIADLSDSRNNSWCIHCGKYLIHTKPTKDHVPTKTLLHEPYPGNLPIILVCHDCNQSFSPDEQYLVSFLSSVICGTADPEKQILPAAKRIIKYNADIKSKIELSKNEYKTIAGETKIIWKPDHESINRVVIKNARGHAFYEYGEPMLDEPTSVIVKPIPAMTVSEREEFEAVPSTGFWPEVGSRMMTRVLTGQDLDGPWVIVQDQVYRYSVCQIGTMLVRSVMSEYLATEVYWD